MKPLDYDLRVRIIDAIEAGEKMPRVAARFGVSYAVVKKLKYQYRDTGNLDSHMDRCGRKPSLSAEQRERLGELVTEDHSRTLEQLHEELGVTCCLATIWNELKRQNISYKKNAAGGRAGSARRKGQTSTLETPDQTGRPETFGVSR